MANIFTKLKNLIYNPREKELTPAEAEALQDQVKKTLLTMRSNSNMAHAEVQAAIQMARNFPKGHPRYEHYRQMVKLRLVMQQYLEKMTLTMETISSQIQLAQLSAEMGAALQDATTLVGSYKRDMPSFTGFVRKFMKTLAPMNEALNGGLDEMTAALDQLCGATLDGVYSEADLDLLIQGEVNTIAPVLPEKPVVAEQPAAAPVAEKDDLLSMLEKQMPNFTSEV